MPYGDENATVLVPRTLSPKRGLQKSDGVRNVQRDSVLVKPVASKARPQQQQLRFQDHIEAFSPATTPLGASSWRSVETTGGGVNRNKVHAGRTPHNVAGGDDDAAAALSPLPLGSLFNYDYSYQSVVKPVRESRVLVQQQQQQGEEAVAMAPGLRLSPSPLPQRSRPPSDQFTASSSTPSPMKQQTVPVPEQPPSYEAAIGQDQQQQQNQYLHQQQRHQQQQHQQQQQHYQYQEQQQQHQQQLLESTFQVPLHFLQGLSAASEERSDEAAESIVSSLISPTKKAPFSALKDRVREETRGDHASPSSSARAMSAPPVSPSVLRTGPILHESQQVFAADDTALHLWGFLHAQQQQHLQPLQHPWQQPATFGHHSSIPVVHGLDTRAPVGMYRTDLERMSLYSGKLNHFDDYQRLLAVVGANSKSGVVEKLGLDLGVSLSRPGLGSRKVTAQNAGPPEAARNLVAGTTCPRPEWNEMERAVILQQASLSQSLPPPIVAPVAVAAGPAAVVTATAAAFTAPAPREAVASPRDVAAVAALRHVVDARRLVPPDNVNFDVSIDSSLEDDFPKKNVAKSQGRKDSMTAQLYEGTNDDIDFGLDEIMASLGVRKSSAAADTASMVPTTRSSKMPVFASRAPVFAASLRLGAAQRVKTSLREPLHDDSSEVGFQGILASPVQPRGADYHGGKFRDLYEEEDSDITFDTAQVQCRDTRQSVVSFSVDVGLHDGSERDDSGMAYLESSSAGLAAAAGSSPTFADADTSAYSTVATTISVDNSFMNDSFGNETSKAAAPRLVVGPRRRKCGAVAEDMKEITLQCVPGEFATIVLTFSNKRSSKLILRPRAILVRFDRTTSAGESDRLGDISTATVGPSGNIFQVSPSLMNLQSGESGSLYITFSPTQDAEGIYGGALKIKSRGKSFVLLLRGEAKRMAQVLQQEPVRLPVTAQVSVPVDCERERERRSDFYSEVKPVSQEQTPAAKAPCDPLLSRTIWLKRWLQKERQMTSALPSRPDSKVDDVPQTLLLTCSSRNADLVLRNNASHELAFTLSCSASSLLLSASHVVVPPYAERSVVVRMTSGEFGGDTSLPSCHVGYIMVSESGGVRESVVEVRLELRPSIAVSSPSSSVWKMNSQQQQQQQQQQTLTPSPLGNRLGQGGVGTVDAVRIRAASTQHGVFFRRAVVDFGTAAVGSVCQIKVELCNATSHPVDVILSDPSLPFLVVRTEVSIRPHAFVHVVVRFVPGMARESSQQLTAQTLDGAYHFQILLLGRAE